MKLPLIFNKISLIIICCIILFSCKKDPEIEGIKTNDRKYTVPVTYNFENVDYSGQLTRIAMLDAIIKYLETGSILGTVLDAAKIKNMYANSGSPFGVADLNTSGKQLKDKTFTTDQTLMESYFDSIALASQSKTVGSNGIAGVVTSSTGKQYLCSGNGIDYAELTEKGIMGAVFYYQAVSYYLENIATKDNTTVTQGKGTEMEHNWDEAFGYFSVPKDFPTNNNVGYWGKYCNTNDAVLGINKTMMDALIKGRAAITNKDNATRDEAKKVVSETWEKVVAATAIHYINRAKANFADDALRNHTLSETLGFIQSLNYNLNKKISAAQITEVKGYIGDNLYNVTTANLDKARDVLSTIYGFDAVKTIL